MTTTDMIAPPTSRLGDADTPVRILAFVGSLRRQSYNHTLFRIAEACAPADVELRLANIADLPFYDEDLDQVEAVPQAVRTFREEVQAADGFLFITPEYNHSLPAVLKNAIDWASRPREESGFPGKVAALMGASTGQFGAARAQQHLRSMSAPINLVILPQPSLTLPYAARHLNVDAPEQSDSAILDQVGNIVRALRDWARIAAASRK